MSSERIRSSNFTNCETKLLVDLVVNKYRKIIDNKMSDAITWRQKDAAWKNLAIDFNEQSTTLLRNEKTLKMKYEGLKKILRKKYAAYKAEGQGTEQFLDYEKKLLSILSMNVEGLPSSYDSDPSEASSTSTGGQDQNIRLEPNVRAPTTGATIEDQNVVKPDLQHSTSIEIIDQEKEILLSEPNCEPSTSSGKKSCSSPEKSKMPITKKMRVQEREEINKKISILADGRSELLKYQLEVAKKELQIKNLELKMKEKQYQHNEREHELKIKILEKQYNNL